MLVLMMMLLATLPCVSVEGGETDPEKEVSICETRTR